MAEVDTTTLAVITAADLGAVLTNNIVRNFMLKNLATHFHVSIPNLGDSFVVCLVQADATASQIASALSSTSQNPEDSVAYNNGQQEVRIVWDIQTIHYEGMVAGGSVQQKVQWKLPPKGVPVLKGRGLKIWCFNTDTANAFSNGPSFKVINKIMGGWF